MNITKSSLQKPAVLFLLLGAIIILGSSSCGKDPDPNDEPIPNVGVSEFINLQLPSNIALANTGSWMLISGGVKGIFVYHNFDDTYIAFDRCCSYRPNDVCSILTPDSSGFFLHCGTTSGSTFTPCCDSKFQYDGTITQGPAAYPLKRYNTSLDGSMLHIFN